MGNVATQGLSIVTGLQKSFDWRGVAASAASGYVSASAGAWTKGLDWSPAGQSLASSMAGGMASAVVRGGSIGRALPGIIGDALGAALTVGNQLGGDIAAGSRIDPANPYGYQGAGGGISNWRDSAPATIPSNAQLSNEDVAWLYAENSWLGLDAPPSGVQYADSSKVLNTGVATDAGPTSLADPGRKLITPLRTGVGIRPSVSAVSDFTDAIDLTLDIAQDAAEAPSSMRRVDYSLLPQGTSIRWLPEGRHSAGEAVWDSVKAGWNSVVVSTVQLGADVFSAYARTSANYQETLGAGWIGPRMAAPYSSEGAFKLSVPAANYDTPYGPTVERLADVAQLFMGGYGGLKWAGLGAKTLTVGTGLAYSSDADASLLGSTRKLLIPALGDSVVLERMTNSGDAIIRTAEMSYAQLGRKSLTQDYRNSLAELRDLDPLAQRFQAAVQNIRDRLTFNDLSEQWRTTITEARLTRPKEPWIANRWEAAAFGTETHEGFARMLGKIPDGHLYEYKRVGPDLVPKNPLGLKMEITNYTPSLNAVAAHAQKYSAQTLRFILYKSR
ncbi:hypothetical protein [Variovorax sp. V116]|uniref:hypothetical protein n=1 Tax=Variovorax sp. V116 TaxID=3065953 RepID=UPI0034E8594C